MCKHGTQVWVDIINKNQNKTSVLIDSCIAEEIEMLNKRGVITLGCCCGHGKANKYVEWEDGQGRKWKTEGSLPHTLIDTRSSELAQHLGYRVYPFYFNNPNFPNGKLSDYSCVIYLKTGDLYE